MAKNKTTATRGAPSKRVPLGFWTHANSGRFVLFSDGFTRAAFPHEIKTLPELPPALVDGYRSAAHEEAEKKEAAEAEAKRKARVKHFRVRWTEEYEQVREAEDEEQAKEQRDDDNAFQGCTEISAQEVARCSCEAKRACGNCGGSGWAPVLTLAGGAPNAG